ncbi:MAG: hypothetical protein HY420_04740 [Candidatus Kerfeldbacteria bacterium]|nr:hypothetical protein [Candidatus Kerfeldbacteria bacterium]
MISRIAKLFRRNAAPKDDFSEFFRNAPIKEKKKLFRQVVSEANRDQKQLVDRYNRLSPKTT